MDTGHGALEENWERPEEAATERGIKRALAAKTEQTWGEETAVSLWNQVSRQKPLKATVMGII